MREWLGDNLPPTHKLPGWQVPDGKTPQSVATWKKMSDLSPCGYVGKNWHHFFLCFTNWRHHFALLILF